MKVTAQHWVNHGGHWYRAGETYDDGRPEAETTAREPEPEPKPEPEQPKRTRKRAVKED